MSGERKGVAPFLTICIATYERAEQLRRTVECILAQLPGPEVELLVVDGASRDHTARVMESFVSRSRLVRYLRLASKGGVDNDFRKGLEDARGKYVWFFCDDDFLADTAVEKVLAALHTHSPEVLIVNGEARDEKCGEVLNENLLRIRGGRIYAQDRQLEFFRDVVAYITYIGAVVIRRELWLQRPHQRYSGSELAHIGMIFHESLPGIAVVIGEPLVRLSQFSSQWSSRAFRIWMINWPGLIWSFDWIPERIRRAIVPRYPWRNIPKLIILRAVGDYDLEKYTTQVRPLEKNFLYRAVTRAVALIPRRPVRLLVLACYSMFLPGRKQRIFQLKRSRFAPGQE